MKLTIGLLPVLFATGAMAQPNGAALRILLGVDDQASAKWDGSVSAAGAEITAIEPWRFDKGDSINGASWVISTHTPRLIGSAAQTGSSRIPVVPNGVIVRLSHRGADVALAVKTVQGSFNLRLADAPYGKTLSFLDGKVRVDQVPPIEQITSDPQEQDLPAAAAANDGSIWLAYMQFVHNKDHDKLRANFVTAPAEFSAYSSPPGGDQILAKTYRNGTWGAAIEVTPPGGDLYRPAIAVNGSGAAWVFWSQNDNHNFDVWARRISKTGLGTAIRLSTQTGTDMDVAVATDSAGRIWVVWQAWEKGRASIAWSAQTGDGFSPPKPIAPVAGNQWNPAIAADSTGRVSVAWDTYENGNYDVMMRTAVHGSWGKVAAVADTSRYEAYPSIAYDPSGRLWVAYEEGGEGWGKDFGAYKSTGISLYQGRAVRLRGFEPDGRAVQTAPDPGTVMTGAMSYGIDSGHQNDSTDWLDGDAQRAQKRVANRGTANLIAPKNTAPRLAVDGSGRIWIAYRSPNPIWWNAPGSVWFEYLVSYDGSQWTAPVFLTHSDNLLDNRPALVCNSPGEVWVIGSSDKRSQFDLALKAGSREISTGLSTLVSMPPEDPFNNDLYANRIRMPPAGNMATVPAPRPPASNSKAEVTAERGAIARMRAYRTSSGGENLRVLRGEFHRHSETSIDGSMDGTLLDQWRYIIDTADLDWVGCCDHDNGSGREYTWWLTQKQTDLFYAPGRFSSVFSYERSVSYPEGHRNVLFAQRGIRVLPRLPKVANESTGRAPDTLMLYRYLKQFNGLTASHTSATLMGTDWRDNDSSLETSVEIYQGDRQSYEKPGVPRGSSPTDSVGGYRPKGYIDRALEMGYLLAFEASSDHVSTHMSFANVLAADVTREAIMDGLRKRHVYASTDNILAEFKCGDHMMGDVFSTDQAPAFEVQLNGTGPFSKVVVVKDNQYVYSLEPNRADVKFNWRDASPQPGKRSYYYVRGEQADGEIVWVSPMWITYSPR